MQKDFEIMSLIPLRSWKSKGEKEGAKIKDLNLITPLPSWEIKGDLLGRSSRVTLGSVAIWLTRHCEARSAVAISS
jgi:hypothetical protein